MEQLSITAKAHKPGPRSDASPSSGAVARGTTSVQDVAAGGVRSVSSRRRSAGRDRKLLGSQSLTIHADEIERIREEERTATARDIHDDIGGALAALKLRFAAIARLPEAQGLGPPLAEVTELIDAAAAATQRVIRSLRPGALENGLAAALDAASIAFAQRTSIACRFRTNHDGDELPAAQSTAIYRVCQEALTNIQRHSQAKNAQVVLRQVNGRVQLEVRDDGIGFDPERVPRDRFGLEGIRERARR